MLSKLLFIMFAAMVFSGKELEIVVMPILLVAVNVIDFVTLRNLLKTVR